MDAFLGSPKVERFLTLVLLSTFVFDFCLSLGIRWGLNPPSLLLIAPPLNFELKL